METQELVDFVRLMIGDVDESTLPTKIIDTFLHMQSHSLVYPENSAQLPLVKFNTVVQCVRWIMVSGVTNFNATISERLEKIGDETISIKTENNWMESWSDFLDWLLANPGYVDPELNETGSGVVIIGGVRKDEYDRVKNDSNSLNGFDVGGIVPYSPNPMVPRRYPQRKPPKE